MKQQIYDYILKHRMIEEGDSVCAAFSGGADSVCLLTVLHMLIREGKISCSLTACHLNHMLRGKESDADEAFVRAYCAELGIPLVVVREDVSALALNRISRSCDHTGMQPEKPEASGSDAGMQADHPAGLEAAGREARERLYRLCIREHGATKIALAHHMDDQAETVLFHMARGAGLQGLSGIRPVDGVKIRPLLAVRRMEIEQWLRKHGIAWCNDTSNASDDYARNRIRHRILPVMESAVNAGSVRHIAEAAETIRLADQFLKTELEKYSAVRIREQDGGRLVSRNLLEDDAYIRRALILRALAETAGVQTDFGQQHTDQVQDLLEGAAGRQRDLPNGIKAVRIYEGVLLRKSGQDLPADTENPEQSAVILRENAVFPEVNTACSFAGEFRIKFADYLFKAQFAGDVPSPIPEKTYTKWLNCDRITGNIVIRTRRPGDYIRLDVRGGRQSVKAWMINQKIPRDQRDRIPLVVHENPDAQQGAEVLWIVGGRIGASARVDGHTKHVLKLAAERIKK